MNYKEFRKFVMQLLNQYSARGVELLDDYNDQTDYFVRVPGLYNACMLEMVMGPAPLIAIMEPDEETVQRVHGFVLVPEPDDFLRMTEDGLPMMVCGRMTRVKGYWAAGGKIAIREDLYDHAILEYCRQPERLGENPSDSQALDGTLEMQTAAAYYVAAMLCMQDDAFAYAALRNEYDDRLSAMKKRLRAENFFVVDQMNIGYDPY